MASNITKPFNAKPDEQNAHKKSGNTADHEPMAILAVRFRNAPVKAVPKAPNASANGRDATDDAAAAGDPPQLINQRHPLLRQRIIQEVFAHNQHTKVNSLPRRLRSQRIQHGRRIGRHAHLSRINCTPSYYGNINSASDPFSFFG